MKKIIYILIVGLLFSCTSNTIYKKPKNLIPKDSMASLLTDMYIASAAKNVKNKQLQKKVNYMPLVYNRYKIDSLRFQESNVYYSSVVEQYNEILLKVKENLEAQQKFYTDSLKINDSIKRAKTKKIKKENIERIKKGIKKEKKPFSKVKELESLELKQKKKAKKDFGKSLKKSR